MTQFSMRINAGKFKGFPILTKDIASTRPTSDKVKQAIFNVLGGNLSGKCALDLFSGFGALGLEALSRGAALAVFVESNSHCVRLIQENLRRMKVEEQAKVLSGDVFRVISRLTQQGDSFDIVFSDAPYPQVIVSGAKQSHRDCFVGLRPPRNDLDRTLNTRLLKALAGCAILRSNALLVLQHERSDSLGDPPAGLKMLRVYRYGRTRISIYKKES